LILISIYYLPIFSFIAKWPKELWDEWDEKMKNEEGQINQRLLNQFFIGVIFTPLKITV